VRFRRRSNIVPNQDKWRRGELRTRPRNRSLDDSLLALAANRESIADIVVRDE
jgi:predicted nucleic acid-binding protein